MKRTGRHCRFCGCRLTNGRTWSCWGCAHIPYKHDRGPNPAEEWLKPLRPVVRVGRTTLRVLPRFLRTKMTELGTPAPAD